MLNDYSLAIPVTSDEVLITSDVDEQALVAKFNEYLISDKIREVLQTDLFVNVPCNYLNQKYLDVLQKYFNEGTGWKLDLVFITGPCSGCTSYKNHIRISVFKKKKSKIKEFLSKLWRH